MFEKYIKQFDLWNKNKKKINNLNSRPKRFKKGEIWWVACGINVGTVIDGKGNFFLRPFLIIKKNDNKSAICLPLTSKASKIKEFYVLISVKGKKHMLCYHRLKR